MCLELWRSLLLGSLHDAFLLDAVLPGVEEEQRQRAVRTDRKVGVPLPGGAGFSPAMASTNSRPEVAETVDYPNQTAQNLAGRGGGGVALWHAPASRSIAFAASL